MIGNSNIHAERKISVMNDLKQYKIQPRPKRLSSKNLLDIVMVNAGNTNRRGRLSTVDLLIRVARFFKKVNNVFNFKSS